MFYGDVKMESIELEISLKGDVANVVNELIHRGYSESKQDLVRTAIIFYATQLGLVSPKSLHKNILRKIKLSGKKYSDEEIKHQIREIR